MKFMMNRFSLAAIGILMASSAFAQTVELTNLSVGDALKKAKEEKKFLVVYLYNQGCYPCTKMENEALSSSALYSFDKENTMIVKAELTEESFNVLKPIAEINSVPSAVVLYPNGDLYSSLYGTDIKDYLNSYLSSLSSDYDYYLAKSAVEEDLKKMVSEYKSGKRDKDFLLALLEKLDVAENTYYLYSYDFDIYDYDIIEEYFNKVTPEELFANEQGFQFYESNETKILSPRSEYMLKNMDEMYLKHGSEATAKVKSLLKTELYTLASAQDNYGLTLLEGHIMKVVVSDLLKKEFAGYFKRIKTEMKKNNLDYSFWNDSEYYYDGYDY